MQAELKLSGRYVLQALLGRGGMGEAAINRVHRDNYGVYGAPQGLARTEPGRHAGGQVHTGTADAGTGPTRCPPRQEDQAYLTHLRDAGFVGAPLPFGVDEQGREVLSFVPGDMPCNPLPPETVGDDVLVALARLIRVLHEASAGWVPPPGAVWGGTPTTAGRVAGRAELVSHCDYYPENVVFRGGLPVALIDFDLAHPTTRLYDIANASGTRRCAGQTPLVDAVASVRAVRLYRTPPTRKHGVSDL